MAVWLTVVGVMLPWPQTAAELAAAWARIDSLHDEFTPASVAEAVQLLENGPCVQLATRCAASNAGCSAPGSTLTGTLRVVCVVVRLYACMSVWLYVCVAVCLCVSVCVAVCVAVRVAVRVAVSGCVWLCVAVCFAVRTVIAGLGPKPMLPAFGV